MFQILNNTSPNSVLKLNTLRIKIRIHTNRVILKTP